EDRVEAPGLGFLREVYIITNIGQRQRRGGRMPPRRLMMATAMNEQIEVQLTCHAAATRRRFRAFIMVLLRRWQLRRGLEYTAFPDDGSATQPWQEMAPLRR